MEGFRAGEDERDRSSSDLTNNGVKDSVKR